MLYEVITQPVSVVVETPREEGFAVVGDDQQRRVRVGRVFGQSLEQDAEGLVEPFVPSIVSGSYNFV